MARSNYKFEKRQRELRKQKKKAEKMERKLQKNTPAPNGGADGNAPQDGEGPPLED